MTLHQLDTLIEKFGDVTVLQAQSIQEQQLLRVDYFGRMKEIIATYGDITLAEANKADWLF